MNIIFRICSIFCIATNIQTSLQADLFQLEANAKPDVNCLLFGNIGCHFTCSLIGKLFVEGGQGSCGRSFTCECKFSQPYSIDDIWFSKFEPNTQSTALLNQMKKYQNRNPYKIALETVKDPLLTDEKAKNILTALLPKSKLANSLKPSNGQLISMYVKDIDNFNEKDSMELSAFVKSQLSTIPEKVTEEIARNNYKARMDAFVNKNDDEVTIGYVTKQLKMISGSPFITEVLKKLEEKKKLFSVEDDEVNEDEDESSKKVTDTIASFVTKELINLADKNQKSPDINGNKSSQSNTSIPDTRLQKDESRASFSNTGQETFGTPTANKTTTKRSSQWKPSVKLINRYADGKGGVIKEWSGSNAYIKYSKDMYGTLTVNWQSNDVTITLKYTNRGDVNQTWKFGDVEINLNNDYKGNIDHKWNLGKTQYIYSKSFKKDPSDGWTGIEDFGTLGKYKNYILSWCYQNKDLFPNRCVLFN